MTNEITEKTSSQKIAGEICQLHGHRISVLVTTNDGSEGMVVCTACGMTLEEIRGAKAANA